MVSNRQRILKIREFFISETDENNKLSYEDVIERLKSEYGEHYEVGIKAIRDDLKEFSDCDVYLEIDKDKFGKKYFYVRNRLFDTNELRTLLDSISTASSINPSYKDDLIRKLKQLTSKDIAESMSSQVYVDSKIVTEDTTLRYCLETIHNALDSDNDITFKYGRYNLFKEFILNDKLYEVTPYGLVWNNGFHYLVAYNKKLRKVINYRVDRIRTVTPRQKTKSGKFNLIKHINSCFNMYPGDVADIEIKFDNHLINAIIDRFGKGVNIEMADRNSFILKTEAAISQGLVRWILNWGSDAEVISPPELVDMISVEVKKMYETYTFKKGDF